MYYSYFDIFSIGIGPSSSHTVGPMRAATAFVTSLKEKNLLENTAHIQVFLYGSLALTGIGHGTPNAVIYGLMGLKAESVDLSQNYIAQIEETHKLLLGGTKEIDFQKNNLLYEDVYYSVGGGTIVREGEEQPKIVQQNVPYPFNTGAELLQICRENRMSIADVVFRNEESLRSFKAVKSHTERILHVMNNCIERGIVTEGQLPGELRLVRRAPTIYRRLEEKFHQNDEDALMIVDWINLWAFADKSSPHRPWDLPVLFPPFCATIPGLPPRNHRLILPSDKDYFS